MAPKVRLSNFEILRVLSMWLIVTQHYSAQTAWGNFERVGPTGVATELVWHKVFINILTTSGKVGVNIFLMLSGYFLNGKPMKSASLVRTWTQTWMWSVMIFTVMWFRRPMWKDDYYRGLFPVTCFGYWFVSTYIAAMLLSAAVAAATKYTTNKQLVGLITVQFIVCCYLNWNSYTNYSNISWFCYGAALGATIRRFEKSLRRIPSWLLLAVIAGETLVNWYYVYVFTTTDNAYANSHGGVNALMRENNSPMPLIMAICIFLLGMRIEIVSPVTNWLASLTLGVYLTHENFFISQPIWREWLRAERWETSPYFVFIVFFQIALVYMTCSLAEYARQRLLGWLERLLVNKVLDGLSWVETHVVDKIIPDDVDEKSKLSLTV